MVLLMCFWSFNFNPSPPWNHKLQLSAPNSYVQSIESCQKLPTGIIDCKVFLQRAERKVGTTGFTW